MVDGADELGPPGAGIKKTYRHMPAPLAHLPLQTVIPGDDHCRVFA